MESTNLIFNLKISTLNLIVENLKEYIIVFDNETIQINDIKKEKLINETCKLINLLIKLPIKEFDIENPRKKFKLFHLLNQNFVKLNLEIDQHNRIKIISCLIKNQDFLNLKSIDLDDKRVILKESKELIEYLIDLPNKNIEIDLTKDLTNDDLNLSIGNDSTDLENSFTSIDKENNSLNKDKQIKFPSKSNKIRPEKKIDRSTDIKSTDNIKSTDIIRSTDIIKSSNQSLNLNNQKNELNRSISEQKKLSSVNKYETKFTFDLNNITAFLKEMDEVFYSDEFLLGDIPWFVEVHSSPNSKASRRDYKYLKIGLIRAEAKNEIGWYCSASFTIRILNQVDDDDDKVEEFRDQIFKAGKWLRGFYEDKFICYRELDQGFIHDDKITISIDLKIEKQSLD